MTRRDWVFIAAFVVAAAVAAAAVAVVLHDRIGHRASTPPDKRQLSFCYPNQGSGGC